MSKLRRGGSCTILAHIMEAPKSMVMGHLSTVITSCKATFALQHTCSIASHKAKHHLNQVERHVQKQGLLVSSLRAFCSRQGMQSKRLSQLGMACYLSDPLPYPAVLPSQEGRSCTCNAL